MPLTQETRLDNNNDHNYRHKKFKKMASTIAVFPNTFKGGDSRHKDIDSEQTTYNTSISNGSIAAAHPEIEKIKETTKLFDYLAKEKNVQINFNGENIRVSDVNDINPVSGHTSFTNEFSNKTENLENDFIRDTHVGGTIGRNVCPYCKLSCAKPSVLQKHIRAHTNERPYPCEPCGFAFKTKSNLYKHRRSRTHVLRLQGAEVPTTINEEESGSESDSSLPSTSVDNSSDISVYNRNDNATNSDFSPPDISNDRITPPTFGHSLQLESNKSKTIYKPKFRAKFFQEVDEKDKTKKTISTNADFLTEHISKIISDNEAIVDVIESPLQKKYSKIKQIAERKHILVDSNDIKSESSPLNLTKSHNDSESSFRKRSHSESFTSVDNQKHPLNPEGSIIKDLLLKNQANGLNSLPHEIIDGLGPVYTCPLCPIMYRSAENLEAHRLHYCKGSTNSSSPVMNASQKTIRSENIFMRSNSVNVRLPESPSNSFSKLHLSKSPPLRNKPDNIIIIKQETNDVIAPLPSPGPLLGNTRLVDSRVPPDYRNSDSIKMKSASPKRKLERSDTYSPKLLENISPRSTDLYSQTKIRCIENNTTTLRSLDEISKHMRHNSTSLQMFGGEVKIVDHSGSTTTLRIEPSKNQLSPILIHQNLSPSKIGNESEASSVVVRSGLHSGGTMVHNPPTPQPQTPRISISNVTGIPNSSMPNIHDITHFQFPPLSAITAFNPLTLPPLSPTSPSAPSTILHGGKLIPHVPGMPGPNTPGVFMGNKSVSPINILCGDNNKKTTDTQHESSYGTYMSKTKGLNVAKYEQRQEVGKNLRTLQGEPDKLNKAYNVEMPQYTLPIIKIGNVDEPNVVSKLSPVNKQQIIRLDGGNKRHGDGFPRMSIIKEGTNYLQFRNKSSEKISNSNLSIRNSDTKTDNEIKSYNFENFITKAEIYSKQIQTSAELQKNKNATPTTLVQNERSETSYFQKNNAAKNGTEERKPKFLRPSSLPLKPGTFTPKKHHGITPNANTMPLVSPETPRPAKAYGQLYLNGNAYTYLGLKCSTKVSYCTINRPQPTYVPNQHFLSMYSNWQLLSELTPDPLGLTASTAMSLYDSRHRPQNIVAAVIKQDLILTHSSQWNQNSKDNKQGLHILDSNKSEEGRYQGTDSTVIPKKELAGGFESNEEYTYVRGRGRGRYVCSECGIRCKKPSMLKKHIRTHTDVRPYTCTHCAFSFKTKGNLTKHMKSKAHYKKCNELGINPNEGQDLEGGETAQCSGETDDETESEVDEGIEGETESSDTEICKSRLPEHEAARCLLSLGGTRQATSTTPGLITSARPSTYPYTPGGLESTSCDQNAETLQIMDAMSVDSSMDGDSEPMDLSKNEIKTSTPEIPTARESSVLASLASNTAKLPQHQTHWSNGEPMLHTYLTERALLDSKIKQSQLTSNLSRLRKVDLDNSITEEKNVVSENNKITSVAAVKIADTVQNAPCSTTSSTMRANETENVLQDLPRSKEEVSVKVIDPVQVTHSSTIHESKRNHTSSSGNAENAKYVVSEYLKHARINLIKTYDASTPSESSADVSNNSNMSGEENRNGDDINVTDTDSPKLTNLDHDPVAPKVVIGAGGVAFKVSKGKEYDGTPPYSPGRLMEDGRRVCDFCNKTFTKPSQLRLHLNIHYMERPFRCSACAVSFRTRGHLQKHERSGSHHNKVSMTSTFGAATSLNPRPFGCSDCNIAFRIHGHLAKHLRSKMHVMRLECLFKLPFGTFTEIERAGVSLTDIDTTDCASSLTSLQSLARKLHEKDPTKLEYREPNGANTQAAHMARDSSEDEDIINNPEKAYDCVKDSDMKTIDNSEDKETD